MAVSVLRAPMTFFETTPIGRVLNRFSNDIYKVDEVIGRVFNMFSVIPLKFSLLLWLFHFNLAILFLILPLEYYIFIINNII